MAPEKRTRENFNRNKEAGVNPNNPYLLFLGKAIKRKKGPAASFAILR